MVNIKNQLMDKRRRGIGERRGKKALEAKKKGDMRVRAANTRATPGAPLVLDRSYHRQKLEMLKP